MNIDSRNHKLNKILVIASVLNIIGLVSILIPIFKLTPLTLISSVTFGGILIAISVVLYIYVVILDMREKGVL